MIPMISGFVELGCRIVCAISLPLLFKETGLFFVEPIAWIGATILLIYWYFRTVKQWKINE